MIEALHPSPTEGLPKELHSNEIQDIREHCDALQEIKNDPFPGEGSFFKG